MPKGEKFKLPLSKRGCDGQILRVADAIVAYRAASACYYSAAAMAEQVGTALLGEYSPPMVSPPTSRRGSEKVLERACKIRIRRSVEGKSRVLANATIWRASNGLIDVVPWYTGSYFALG